MKSVVIRFDWKFQSEIVARWERTAAEQMNQSKSYSISTVLIFTISIVQDDNTKFSIWMHDQ